MLLVVCCWLVVLRFSCLYDLCGVLFIVSVSRVIVCCCLLFVVCCLRSLVRCVLFVRLIVWVLFLVRGLVYCFLFVVSCLLVLPFLVELSSFLVV